MTDTSLHGRDGASGDPPRVLLVVPIPTVSQESLNPLYHFIPLGLACLGAYLLERGIEVRVFDGGLDSSYDSLKREIDSFSPDCIGITSHTYNVVAADKVAAFAKSIRPDVPVVLGGAHATAIPRETLEQFRSIDYVVIGEGEDSLLRLVLSDGGGREEPAAIDGIAFRDGPQVHVNEREHYIDVEGLAVPAWHLFRLEDYVCFPTGRKKTQAGARELPIQTSRGCPYRCAFCFHIFGKTLRRRPMESVVEEIRRLVFDYGATSLFFADETFSASRRYTQDLCRAIVEEVDRPIEWTCATRADRLDEETADAMAAAGCTTVFLGLESGNREVLASIRKEFDLDAVDGAVRRLRRAGITSHGNFILGLPGETKETILDTIAFARGLPLDFVTFGLFTPYPGSELAKRVEASKEYRILTRDWEQYSPQTRSQFLEQPGLSSRELARLFRWAYIRVYLTPGRIWTIIRNMDLKDIFKRLWRKWKSRRRELGTRPREQSSTKP